MNNSKKIESILEGLYSMRVNEKSNVPTDPKEYKKYIADNFGEALVAGDVTSAMYEKGMEHIKKLAKMMKISPKEAMQGVMNLCGDKGSANEAADMMDSDMKSMMDSMTSMGASKDICAMCAKGMKDMQSMLKGDATAEDMGKCTCDMKDKMMEMGASKEMCDMMDKCMSGMMAGKDMAKM